MQKELLGIHHVTAIAGHPQGNVDFYAGLLGLRLVKRTVNFDDPGTYHLYYGDESGSPGTIITFFPWPNAPRGRRGAGQATVTAFSIPTSSTEYWMDRLKNHHIPFDTLEQRFEEQVLTVYDPDGLQIELVTDPFTEKRSAWEKGPVPAEHAIRGFFGLTLTEREAGPTESLLTGAMGFRPVAEAGNRCRFELGDSPASRAFIDLLILPDAPRGQVAVGTVHHVAWRTRDDQGQLAWQRAIGESGINVTPVMDRQYFHSIYYREPGGVLFEIATDPPGFAIDEPIEELGQRLKLPPWLEPRRAALEQTLPALNLPGE
jgi:glyoxalase family protein